MARSVLLALAVAIAITACREVDSVPTAPSSAVAPRLAFTGGSGTMLGSTTAGQLVLIDLDADSVTLIGDSGSMPWWDIARDGDGALLAVTELGSSCPFGQPCSILYELNPATGDTVRMIGSTGQFRIRAIDFAGDSLFGTGYGNDPELLPNLFAIDTTTGVAVSIPDSTGTFGVNPFDTLFNRNIAPGGFAVHPTTGDLWGLENEDSGFTVLYRINRVTGVADSILKIGLDGTPVYVPFFALHILSDGTFVAAKDLAFSPDSVLFEVSSTPDSVSGLAEIQPIPLAFDTAVAGVLTGLEAGVEPPPSLSCTSAMRGQLAQCSISGAVDSVLAWRWIGATSTSGGGVDTVFTSQNITTWAGPAVATGNVEVDVVAGGQPQTLPAAALFVTPRAWSWGPSDWSYVPSQAPSCLGDDPLPFSYNPSGNQHVIDSLLLGRNGPRSTNCADALIFVEPNLGTQPDSGFVADSVASGPNAGLSYVASWSYRMDRGSHVDVHLDSIGVTVALQRNSEINQCSHGGASPPDTVNFFVFNEVCKGVPVAPLIAGIEQHEGYGIPSLPDTAASGHQRRIEFAASQPINNPAGAIETAVTPQGSAILTGLVQILAGAVDDRLYQAADTAHVYVTNNYCLDYWLWDSTTTTQQGQKFNRFPLCD